ncbi:hypothetical protein QW131_28915 [Roseibium salinum]|nr:hypothetical protein [Roseibium salinum]
MLSNEGSCTSRKRNYDGDREEYRRRAQPKAQEGHEAITFNHTDAADEKAPLPETSRLTAQAETGRRLSRKSNAPSDRSFLAAKIY